MNHWTRMAIANKRQAQEMPQVGDVYNAGAGGTATVTFVDDFSELIGYTVEDATGTQEFPAQDLTEFMNKIQNGYFTKMGSKRHAQVVDILNAMETVAPDKFTYDAMDDESLINIRGLIRDGMASGKYTAPVYQTALDDVEKAMMRRGLDITARRRAQTDIYNTAVEQGKLIADLHSSGIQEDIQEAIVMMKQSGDIMDEIQQQEMARGLVDGVRLKLQEKKLAKRTAAASGQEMAQQFLLRYVPGIEEMAQGIVQALEYAPGGDDFDFDSWELIHNKAQEVAIVTQELKTTIQNAQFRK